MRALVTGVAGQDGSYLAELLLARGWDVHGLVRPGEPATDVPEGVRLHAGDLTDEDGVRRLLRGVVPERLYNLAGSSSVARSWEHPVEAARVNALGAVHLMHAAVDAAVQHGVEVRVVQASSAEIFGDPDDAPQTERTPVRPVSPYGAAKAHAHHVAGVLRGSGVHCSSLVLYNHESPRRPPHFVTRKVAAAAAAAGAGVPVELALGNLDARRDWGWAPDHVRAFLLASEADEPGDHVVATGEAHSVRDLVEACFARAGAADWSRYVTSDPNLLRDKDARLLVGDPSGAAARIGWRPEVAFDEVVARLVDAEVERLAER